MTCDERCFICARPIYYSDHLGVWAWRHHGSTSEFCNDRPNSISRATPDGSEER